MQLQILILILTLHLVILGSIKCRKSVFLYLIFCSIGEEITAGYCFKARFVRFGVKVCDAYMHTRRGGGGESLGGKREVYERTRSCRNRTRNLLTPCMNSRACCLPMIDVYYFIHRVVDTMIHDVLITLLTVEIKQELVIRL